MMRKIVIYLFLYVITVIPTLAYADEYYKFVKITCAQEVNFLEIQATGIYNIADFVRGSDLKKLSEKYGLFLGGNKRTIENTCILDGKKIKTEIVYWEARERGECGADPSAILRIYENGAQIVKDMPFHETCRNTPSIFKVSLDNDDFLEMCVNEGKYFTKNSKLHCKMVFKSDLKRPLTMPDILSNTGKHEN